MARQHNLIQAPELVGRLQDALGLRQRSVTPTLNEGIQAVVLLHDLSKPEHNLGQNIGTIAGNAGGGALSPTALQDAVFAVENRSTMANPKRLRVRFAEVSLSTALGAAQLNEVRYGWRTSGFLSSPANSGKTQPSPYPPSGSLANLLADDAFSMQAQTVATGTLLYNTMIMNRWVSTSNAWILDQNFGLVVPPQGSLIIQSVANAIAMFMSVNVVIDVEQGA